MGSANQTERSKYPSIPFCGTSEVSGSYVIVGIRDHNSGKSQGPDSRFAREQSA